MFEDDGGELYNGIIVANGYVIGGTLLEGVLFHADMVDGEVILNSVRVAEECEEYLEKLNAKKWLKEARIYFEAETEVFETLDGGNVWAIIVDDDYYGEPQEIEVFSLDDILKRHGY